MNKVKKTKKRQLNFWDAINHICKKIDKLQADIDSLKNVNIKVSGAITDKDLVVFSRRAKRI